ncbi:AAA family ATPase [Dyadobacter luticola]|uniref:RecF/RecN/SMC N-terminal domain-containing protein n=1 Tax=Dyadobacter luticola TaxID=1979387 RepID=A0A5R9KZ86_9BACT|nr:ATP-binding protein [Dyadobacter luticola]TLV01410.1 hypothetical protein FEN17_18440 [Dyadobacter luticola]
MHRISKINLINFKFFFGHQTLELDRKNLLLYGENGSGKSSIYWALYTFLQSCTKSNDQEVRKYFDTANEQNLVNRFAPAGSEAGIEVEFEDNHEEIIRNKISTRTINTRTSQFIKEVTATSDFINYRLLSSIYNWSNRQIIDIFPMFEEHVLMFVNFREEVRPGSSNASDWWTHLKPGLVPRPTMSHPSYRNFQELVAKFNVEFELLINRIIESTNDYIQDKFNEPLKVNLEYIPCSYDAFESGSTTKRNHITLPPKIILTITYIHASLNGENSLISRPQSFLNEARLTCVALAIRFAVLDEKFIEGRPKILVLDDLLVSLDMGNRDTVLELILKLFKDYQILLLTHDRHFFNLCKKRIEYENMSKDWLVKEMYSGIENNIPKPFIPNNLDYVDRAEKYIKEHDLPAAANYLRKEVERLLKYLLPRNKTIALTEEEGSKPLQLDTLMDNFKKHYLDFGGSRNDFKKLKEFKDLLLNPLSHDNIDTPIYRDELERLKVVVLNLRKLRYKTIVKVEDGTEFVSIRETDTDGVRWAYKVLLIEPFKAFKTLDGSWKINDPVSLFERRKNRDTGDIEMLGVETTLLKGYRNIRHRLRITHHDEPHLLDVVRIYWNGAWQLSRVAVDEFNSEP